MEELKKAREKIDRIDEQIADLFAERMDEVEEVIAVKKKNGIPVCSPSREREVLNKVSDRVPEKYEAYSRVLFSTMFELSRSYQSILSASSPLEDTLREAVKNTKAHFPERATVACQGVDGAYSSLAAEKLFKLPNVMYFRQWDGVFSAVEKGLCKYGVLPIENSSFGSVNGVYDLMLHHNFYIVRTVKLHVSHVLLAKEGVKLEDVKEIYSHEQALGQCSEFLKAHPDIKINVCENTAVAAKRVAESGAERRRHLLGELRGHLRAESAFPQGAEQRKQLYALHLHFQGAGNLRGREQNQPDAHAAAPPGLAVQRDEQVQRARHQPLQTGIPPHRRQRF